MPLLLPIHTTMRLRRSVYLAAALLTLAASSFGRMAYADEPPTKPTLRIETNTHTGSIAEMAVDARETFCVTCSEDATLRVWDLLTAKLQKTLRVPYASSEDLYTVAVSPDGKQIACGGKTGYDWDKAACIYLFDRATGAITRRISGFPNAVQRLRYAPDGKTLAVGMCGTDGLRFVRISDGATVAEDKEYQGYCMGIDFRADGTLVTCGLDGMARLYTPDYKVKVRRKLPGGIHPHTVAFSPDGKKIAVGYGDTANISVLSSDDLSLLYAPATNDLKAADNAFDQIAWSRDGLRLYAAGRAHPNEQRGAHIIRRYESEGKGKTLDVVAAGNSIMSLRPLSDGGVLYAAADPLWGAVYDDKANWFESPTMEARGTSLMLSDDATTAQFAVLPGGKGVMRFDAKQRRLQTGIADTPQDAQAKAESANLHPALTAVPGLDITGVHEGMHPTVNGHAIQFDNNERAHCVAILPDHKRFLMGGDFGMRLVDANGKEAWRLPTNGDIAYINVSKDGETGAFLVTDGTIRWFRVKDAAPLLTLFPLIDEKRWVAWTPTGYYDAAAGSEDLIGWNINRGKTQTADFFPVSRFRSTFCRPDVIERVLVTHDEAEALRQADLANGRKNNDVIDVNKTLPPIVVIKSPENNAEQSESAVRVRVGIRTPADAPVTALRALVNGRPIGAARRIQEVANDNSAESEQTLEVTLPAADCQLSVLAENKHGISSPSTITLHWKGKAVEDVIKPKLYVLAVGVSKYQNPAYALDYPSIDVTDFAAALKLQSGRLYRDVETRLLTDDKADKGSILDGLEWIQKQTTSRDVAMIFIAGHGVRDTNGDYYYAPFDFDIDKKRRTGVPFYEVQKTIKDVAGKVLFFVDTCHSGAASGKTRSLESDLAVLVNEMSSVENGAIVFAASTGKESALEDAKWGHGAFTKALLEGLAGKADLSHTGRITVTSLDFFLSERVKELTGGSQHPTTTKPPSTADFPIATTK